MKRRIAKKSILTPPIYLKATARMICVSLAVFIGFAVLDHVSSSAFRSPHFLAYLCFVPIWVSTRMGGKLAGLVQAVGCTAWLSAPLNNPALIAIHFFTLSLLVVISDYLEGSLAHASRLAMNDSLTGIRNRRSGLLAANAMIKSAQKKGVPLAVVVIDCDQFKQINDHWGHAEGDRALKMIAQALQWAVRSRDVVARSGGDEFFVVFEGADLAGALQCAARIQSHVANIGSNMDFPLSVSAGVAVLGRDGGNIDELLARADARMFRQKEVTRAVVDDSAFHTAKRPPHKV